MARTKQSTRRSDRNNLPSKHVHRFGVCAKCFTSLSRWGEGGSNGCFCPPCSSKIVHDDVTKRRHQEGCIGIFIPVVGEVKLVDLDKENPFGKATTCILYRKPSCFSISWQPDMPIWTATIYDDTSQLEYNDRGSAFIQRLGVFDERNLDVRGDVFISGPNGLSLLPEETARFMTTVDIPYH